MSELTLEQLLTQSSRQLGAISDSPRFDAELLLAHSLNKPRSYLRSWPERIVDSASLQRFEQLLQRRLAAEPIAYIFAQQQFWSLDLAVSPDTLIPRPETECLVEQALEKIPADSRYRIADLGTGSGCIALAIASERPACTLIAVDQSQAALTIAQGNAKALGLSNIEFLQSDWLAALGSERFDCIVSNPPYIEPDDPHLAALQHEPHAALVASDHGFSDLFQIIESAAHHLKPGGYLLLEHGYNQQDAVCQRLAQQGYTAIEPYQDYSRTPRGVCAQWFPNKENNHEQSTT